MLPPHPHRPVSHDREMTILSCQEDKVMRLAALPLALSLFPSLPLGGRYCGSSKQGKTFFFFFIVITQNVLVWVWEAPTVLCGPRALLKFKEFPPTVHHFRLAVYMVLAGGRRVLIIPAVVFHPWTSIHPETPTPREDQRSSQTDLISLHWIYEYFYQPSFDLSVSVKHNSFLFYLKNFFFARNGPLEFLFATLSVV